VLQSFYHCYPGSGLWGYPHYFRYFSEGLGSMVNSCHDLWGCGAHPLMRGCDYPRLLVRIHAEQGSNLGALLYAFQLEQNGVVGFATVADVAGVYDHHVVVDLIPVINNKKINYYLLHRFIPF
jgi:hypothetical protein